MRTSFHEGGPGGMHHWSNLLGIPLLGADLGPGTKGGETSLIDQGRVQDEERYGALSASRSSTDLRIRGLRT